MTTEDRQAALEAARLMIERILKMHAKVQGPGGMTDGTCAECWHTWPCPTYHVAAGWGLDSFFECEEEGWCSHEGILLK